MLARQFCAQRALPDAFQATRQDVARALLLFRCTIAALRLAKETGEEGVAVVDREVGMKQLDDVLLVIGSVANVAEQDILITSADRYSVLRRFSPRFLKAFDFRSSTPIAFENQGFRASGLSLITTAIVHWNTVHLHVPSSTRAFSADRRLRLGQQH